LELGRGSPNWSSCTLVGLVGISDSGDSAYGCRGGGGGADVGTGGTKAAVAAVVVAVVGSNWSNAALAIEGENDELRSRSRFAVAAVGAKACSSSAGGGTGGNGGGRLGTGSVLGTAAAIFIAPASVMGAWLPRILVLATLPLGTAATAGFWKGFNAANESVGGSVTATEAGGATCGNDAVGATGATNVDPSGRWNSYMSSSAAGAPELGTPAPIMGDGNKDPSTVGAPCEIVNDGENGDASSFFGGVKGTASATAGNDATIGAAAGTVTAGAATLVLGAKGFTGLPGTVPDTGG